MLNLHIIWCILGFEDGGFLRHLWRSGYMEANSMEVSGGGVERQGGDRRKFFPFYFAGAGFAFLLIAVGLFLFLGSSDVSGGQESFLEQEYAEIDLDVVHREFSGSPGRPVRETFFCQPILVLNPELEDLKAVHKNLQKRINSLRGEFFRVIYSLPAHYFRDSNLLSNLSGLFLKSVNLFLGSNSEGKSIVKKVTFPLFEAPAS